MMALNKGFTLWFTGLSGAGKSTLGTAMGELLRERGERVEMLDGEEVRQSLSKGLGFSKEDRDTNVLRIGFVARLLSRNGVIAIVAAISPYQEARNQVREQHDERFVEVFVDCPIAELVRRDPKGLYAKALRGEIQNFTGISDCYEPPLVPDVHVHTDRETVRESCAKIVTWLEERELIESR